MAQKHEFNMATQQRVDQLGKLVDAILSNAKIELVGSGGARGIIRHAGVPKLHDFDWYDLLFGSKKVGRYGFRFNNGRYECTLDLSGVESQKYASIMEVLTLDFPEIDPEYAGARK